MKFGIREILKAKMGGGMPEPTEPKVDNHVRQAWNDYVSWIDKKGLKGHESLDKNDLGGKMIDAYKKENPDTPISREMIVPIQKEFSKYRDWSLEQVKKGAAKLADGVTPENYMKSLSIVDGIAGQRTTSFQFPSSYLTTFSNGKNLGTENKGFAVPTK